MTLEERVQERLEIIRAVAALSEDDTPEAFYLVERFGSRREDVTTGWMIGELMGW